MNPVATLPAVDAAAAAPAATIRRAFQAAPSTPPGASGPGAGTGAATPPSGWGPSTAPASGLPAALRDVEGVRARLDDLLAQARGGRVFTAQELLCLQADAHRFAQTVELAARAVEHGVQGLRQALNAQV